MAKFYKPTPMPIECSAWLICERIETIGSHCTDLSQTEHISKRASAIQILKLILARLDETQYCLHSIVVLLDALANERISNQDKQ